MDSKIRLTKEGYQQHLASIEQAELELKQIRSLSTNSSSSHDVDWHENQDFDSDKMQEKIARDKLYALKNALTKIVIIDSDEEDDSVKINSIVTIELDFGDEIEVCVVKLVATPLLNLDTQISIKGPLGQAILGKKVDDEVTYKVNDSKIKAKILKIE